MILKIKFDQTYSQNNFSVNNYDSFYLFYFILQEAEAAAAGGEASKYTCLEVSCTDGLRTIKLNRPKKKNALDFSVS